MTVEPNNTSTVVICSCMPGYEGDLCERLKFFIGCPPINPCLNDGQCVEKLHGFKCSCKTNFYGTRCQYKNNTQPTQTTYVVQTTNKHRLNRCKDFAANCLNHGICIDTIFGAKCQCLPQYTGSLCEFSMLALLYMNAVTYNMFQLFQIFLF